MTEILIETEIKQHEKSEGPKNLEILLSHIWKSVDWQLMEAPATTVKLLGASVRDEEPRAAPLEGDRGLSVRLLRGLEVSGEPSQRRMGERQ